MNAVKNDTKATVQKDAKEKTQRTGPNPTSWVGRTYLALLNAKKAMTKEDLCQGDPRRRQEHAKAKVPADVEAEGSCGRGKEKRALDVEDRQGRVLPRTEESTRPTQVDRRSNPEVGIR